MTASTEIALGHELNIGDVIDTWMGRKRIVAIRPYFGPLAYLWNGEARIAEFDIGLGMTIEPYARVPRVALAT